MTSQEFAQTMPGALSRKVEDSRFKSKDNLTLFGSEIGTKNRNEVHRTFARADGSAKRNCDAFKSSIWLV